MRGRTSGHLDVARSTIAVFFVSRSQRFRRLSRMPSCEGILCVWKGEADPEHDWGITYPIWPGNSSASFTKSCRMWLKRRTDGPPCMACCHCDPDPESKTTNGWMIHTYISSVRKHNSIGVIMFVIMLGWHEVQMSLIKSYRQTSNMSESPSEDVLQTY